MDMEKDLVGPHRLCRHDERVQVLSGDVGLLESVIRSCVVQGVSSGCGPGLG